MVEAINQNNALYSQIGGVGSHKGSVVAAIKAASERTGVNFSYLLNEAMTESSLNPTAKASTSSATGLYQFVDQTWLKTIKESGAKHGLGEMADKIQIGGDGIARVTTHADRREILALRNDPQISATMAAELAQSNQRVLERKVGGDVGSTELYMAHFLGANGASNFLNTMKTDPSASAAELLPQAAKANRAVFYDRTTGAPRSVSEVYAQFAQKFDKMPDVKGLIGTAYAQDSMPSQPKWAPSFDMSSRPDFYASRPQPSESAPFTTMLMAQMDMDSFALDTQDYISKIAKYKETQSRSIYSTLASTT